jgi:translation initiation factor IF-3
MEYGRFRFEQDKKAREIKKKYAPSTLKEIRMRYEIADSDYKVKLRSALRFLQHGYKVRLLVMLEGKEVKHADQALALLSRLTSDLESSAVVSEEPRLVGEMALICCPHHRMRSPNT